VSRLRSAALIASLGLALALPPLASLGAPDKAARFYDDAVARFDKGDAAGAVIQLKNALKEDPKLLAAHALLGKAYLAQGDPAAAEDSFDRALQLGIDRSEIALPMARALLAQGKHQALLERFPPESAPPSARAELFFIRGQSYSAIGNTESARRAYDEARRADPKSPAPVLALAELAIREGKLAEAAKLADQAMAVAPGVAGVWHFKGTLALGAGDVKGALDAFGKALELNPNYVEARVARAALLIDLGRLAEANQDIQYLAANQPREPRALYIRAVFSARRGDDRGAREALEALVNALDPVPRDVLKQRAAELLLLAALGHQGLGQREKARQYLDDYLAVRPRDVGARRLLASLMIAQRDNRQAITILEAARREAPNDPQVLALLGSAHMGLGQHNVAVNYLDRALAASGGAADVHAAFGLSLLGGGQHDLALKQLHEAFKKEPGQARSGIALAILHMQRGEPKQAVEVAEAVVKRVPANAYLLNLLGVARLATGDRKGARAAFQEAVAADPSLVAAHLNIGRLDVGDGDFPAARNRFQTVLKRRPSNALAMYELGVAEQAAGQTADAIRWLEKARSADRRHVTAAARLVDLYIGTRATDKALEVAKDADAANPDNLDALAALGRAYLAVGNQQAAQTAFTRMARLASFDAAWQTEIARYQAAANNPQGASYSLEKALSGRPDYLPAQALMVELDLRAGNVAKAEERARSIVKRVPDQAIGHRLLADAAMARKKYPEAIERYRTALAKEQSADGALRLFGAYAAAGDTKAGNEFLESWLRSHRADRTVQHALAEGYVRAGNLASARARYERMADAQGDDASVLNNLANILLLQGDHQKALGYAERAYQLAPGVAAIQDTLGWALVQAGQLEPGIRHLRDARLRDPQSAEIRYHLAVALVRAGRRDEARRELEPVIGPDARFQSRELALGLWRDLSAR
jgi:putative PEP-CTERM system TPR-repeat lipoprotein